MGRKSKVKVGDWFGMWKVVNIADVEQAGNNRKALCECGTCGHTKLVFTNNLLSGLSSRCPYCRDRRSPTMNRYGHPRIRNIKADTVIGSLTVLRVLADTPKQRARRMIEAKCLCGNTITRRVDVIRRDQFPTCHHCEDRGTIYRVADELSLDRMHMYAGNHECRWFDMTVTPPVEHITEGYRARLKREKKGNSDVV